MTLEDKSDIVFNQSFDKTTFLSGLQSSPIGTKKYFIGDTGEQPPSVPPESLTLGQGDFNLDLAARPSKLEVRTAFQPELGQHRSAKRPPGN